MEGPESEEEGKRRQEDVEGLKKPTKQSVKQKLKMEIGYIRYRVANQLASSNPSLKLDDQRLSNILSTLHTPTHPPYALMINSAIAELNEEGGTSESSISAFIAKTYENLPLAHEAILKHHLRILCERREVACTEDELYILLTNNEAENSVLKTKPLKRKRGRERGIGIGGPSKSKRINGGGKEENQLMVLESGNVIEAVEDQSKWTYKKSDNRDPNSNEGVKEVMDVAEVKQLGIGSEESEPLQTDQAAETSGNGQQQAKLTESKKPSLLQRQKLNTQVETQRRKLRSYSWHSVESDTDELPVPAHQAKNQEKEEDNQFMVLESEGVTEAVEDQSERAGTKSDNRVPNLNGGVKEVTEVAQAKQLGIGSEESEPQTELSENQLQLETAEASGKGQQRVKPEELKKPSLSQWRKPNIPAETQQRKLRSYSRHSAEPDTDGTTPKPPLPAHQAKHQEEGKDKLHRAIETSSEKELSLSQPLPRRTLRSCSKLPPVHESPVPTLTLSIVFSEDPPLVQDDPPNLEPDTALAVSNPPDNLLRKKRGRPCKVNAAMPLALAPLPKRDGRGRPRKLKPEADAELALASQPPKRDGRGRPKKFKPEASAELALTSRPPKRDGRGRPRKVKPEANAELALTSPPPKRDSPGSLRKLKPEADAELASASQSVERRGRGRPRKAPKSAEIPLAIFRPGLDDHHEDHKVKGKARRRIKKSKLGTEMVVFRPWDGRFRSKVRGQDSATRL